MVKVPEAQPSAIRNTDDKKRILLVDDDIEHLRLSQLILERKNYEVLVLANCDRLLEKIIKFQPDLIFMDHCMPDMSGLVATRLIKHHMLCHHIPVIYLSASYSISELARKAGADDWLTKPFSVKEMEDKAAFFLNKRK